MMPTLFYEKKQHPIHYFFLFDDFFDSHGHISTFTGRLIPGARHLISIPAGLAKMDIKLFLIYTGAGAAY